MKTKNYSVIPISLVVYIKLPTPNDSNIANCQQFGYCQLPMVFSLYEFTTSIFAVELKIYYNICLCLRNCVNFLSASFLIQNCISFISNNYEINFVLLTTNTNLNTCVNAVFWMYAVSLTKSVTAFDVNCHSLFVVWTSANGFHFTIVLLKCNWF